MSPGNWKNLSNKIPIWMRLSQGICKTSRHTGCLEIFTFKNSVLYYHKIICNPIPSPITIHLSYQMSWDSTNYANLAQISATKSSISCGFPFNLSLVAGGGTVRDFYYVSNIHKSNLSYNFVKPICTLKDWI